MPPSQKITYLKYLILLVAAVFLVLFIRQIDYVELRQDMDRMGIKLFWLMFISLFAYLLSTLGWMLCVHAIFDLRKLKAYFWARQLGETLGTLNPTGIVSGDALRVYLIQKAGVKKDRALSSVITSRGLLWLSYLLVTLVGLGLFIVVFRVFSIYLVVLFFLVIGAGILLSRLLFRKETLSKLTVGITKLTRKKSWITKAEGFQKYNHIMSKLWKDRKLAVFIAAICFSLHYVCGAWEFQYILSGLEVEIPFSSAMILEVGTSFVRSLMTVVPGQVGIEEYSNKYFLQLLGVKNDTVWISVSLIRRFRQLFWIVISIVVYFLFYNSEVKSFNSDNSVVKTVK